MYPDLCISSNMVLRTCPLFIKVRDELISNKMGSLYHLEADYLWGRREKLSQAGEQKQIFTQLFMELQFI